MGDDFDLFPKRENLDPFSFGTKDKEKTEAADEKDPADLLFDQADSKPEVDRAVPDQGGSAERKIVPDEPAVSSEQPQPDAGLDAFSDMSGSGSEEIFGESPALKREPEPELEGPIPDDQSGYGPRLTGQEAVESPEKEKRKPSPFIVIGGAIVLILALLWGALTYLQKEKKVVVPASVPPASARIEVPKAPAKPALVAPSSDEVKAPAPETPAEGGGDTTSVVSPPAPVPPQTKPEPVPAKTTSAAVPPAEEIVRPTRAMPQTGDYSVQVGAFILKTSVRELEKKLANAGLEPFLKEGSTQAMMHFLTVGPFDSYDTASAAVSKLKSAGIDSNPQRVSGGGAVVHAGSYLLEENARKVMKRIRSLGYPVRLSKKETQLPMTFVRVGKFTSRDEASRSRDELKNKGFDAIVVKLQ